MKNEGKRISRRPHILQHVILLVLAVIWLIPIVWLVLNSFSTSNSPNISRFFPQAFTLDQYRKLLSAPDAANQFPTWFKNTFIIAIANCLISTVFVLTVAYAMSRMRFHGRKGLMNVGMILNLFPGALTMVAIYFILKTLGGTNTHWGLILVYAGGSGLGYLIAKGFFDTIPKDLSEAAKIDGATESMTFFRVILPLSKPIIVYTVISAFLAPWMDFMMAKLMLNSGIATDWTVAIGLYGMLDRSRRAYYFGQFCAGGVLVSIPISILFVIMQKFYVEGITGGATKG